MAMIGQLKEINWVDGVLKGSVIRSCKQEISVIVAHPGNTEFYPQVNDTVIVEQVGSEYLLTGIVVDYRRIDNGEWLAFSRDSRGAIKASIHARMDGVIAVGDGSDNVAMARNLNTFLTVLANSTCPGNVPVVTPTPGATCPVAAAILSAMQSAFQGLNGRCDSKNLKAD